jgi:hypothetical protein
MFLFLIEIFLLGCAIAFLFRDKLSDSVLSFLAILLGLFAFFTNVMLLAILGIKITVPLLAILLGVEMAALFLVKGLRQPQVFRLNKAMLWYLGAGIFFIIGCWFFFNKGFVFASPDSLYMIIMGRGILETGLMEWYFSSPLQWGMFVPVLQTIGMLFGQDYSWFIQPVLSLTFLVLFGILIYRASRSLTAHKTLPAFLTVASFGILLTTNMFWVAQYYVHNNLDTAFFLFIVVASIYFAIREQKNAWLGITAIFMILLGMARTENVILAAVIILLAMATRKIPQRQLLWTFLPFLVIQMIWNLIVIRLDPIAFGNLMSVSQLKLVTLALAALTGFLILAGNSWIKKRILPLINPLLWIGMGLLLVLVFILEPANRFLDTWDNLRAMFVTGKWLASFWGVGFLLLLVKADKKRLDSYVPRFFSILIVAFFSMIVILGAVKGNYHSAWYDSANRMYIHILPIMLLYLSLKISATASLKEAVMLSNDDSPAEVNGG